MENEAELIRQQMTETRTALTEKLETLEEEVASKVKGTTETVAETVETVKEAVEGTVHTVKETVENTVETVKDTFDVNRQVERHPWMMFGGAVLLGFVGGRLVRQRFQELDQVINLVRFQVTRPSMAITFVGSRQHIS